MNSEHELGQFIPLHYHYHMLRDRARMSGFRRAIAAAVFPGAKVLEFGGGTGVLSFFAAQQAGHVWCVERNPELVNEARRLLPRNPSTERIEVIHGDAFEYLPPEPVDVVICEMLQRRPAPRETAHGDQGVQGTVLTTIPRLPAPLHP